MRADGKVVGTIDQLGINDVFAAEGQFILGTADCRNVSQHKTEEQAKQRAREIYGVRVLFVSWRPNELLIIEGGGR